jgi:mono/diheme cytochrome c family protein
MIRTLVLLVVGVLLVGIMTGAYFVMSGVNARGRTGAVEAFAAHTVRNVSLSMHTRGLTNPVASSPDVIEEGMEHFADHCAVCHGNDGGGDTEANRGLYPNAPDMRLAATQNLTDAELFYIVENGVRMTGMPGWGNGTKEGETSSWHLVHFIRHLPRLTDDEMAKMEDLNPRTPAEMQQREEEKKFLQGDDTAERPTPATPAHQHGGHE